MQNVLLTVHHMLSYIYFACGYVKVCSGQGFLYCQNTAFGCLPLSLSN